MNVKTGMEECAECKPPLPKNTSPQKEQAGYGVPWGGMNNFALLTQLPMIDFINCVKV